MKHNINIVSTIFQYIHCCYVIHNSYKCVCMTKCKYITCWIYVVVVVIHGLFSNSTLEHVGSNVVNDLFRKNAEIVLTNRLYRYKYECISILRPIIYNAILYYSV